MRITAGEAKGRILKVPDTGTVRPTTDKMRQQLFNMLQHSPWAVGYGFELIGAHVLDGFCGSGSLGLEALSRGSASCVFVDADAQVVSIAKANVTMCRYDAVSQFITRQVQKIGPRPEKILPRNLVLLDPPYNKDLIAPALAALVDGGWLAPCALIVAESEKGFVAASTSLTQIHVRVDGNSQLNVWRT